MRARQSIPLGGGGSGSGGTEDKQWADKRGEGLAMSKHCNELPCPPYFHIGVEEEEHL